MIFSSSSLDVKMGRQNVLIIFQKLDSFHFGTVLKFETIVKCDIESFMHFLTKTSFIKACDCQTMSRRYTSLVKWLTDGTRNNSLILHYSVNSTYSFKN